ncbi:MAG: TIGR02300 family protein [Alphaproteobacteria bacterium]|nr:TIGR02300 family protein [Alphaproteobacteria bacterium]
MAKPEWGQKRTCPSCGARFYDLKRTPIQCPKCEARFDSNLALKSHRPAAVAKRKVTVAKPLPDAVPLGARGLLPGEIDDDVEILVDADDDVVVVEEVDGEDEGLIEDASDLGGDEEDMAEVMEHMENEVGDG